MSEFWAPVDGRRRPGVIPFFRSASEDSTEGEKCN